MTDSAFLLVIVVFFLFAILEETHRKRLNDEKRDRENAKDTTGTPRSD